MTSGIKRCPFCGCKTDFYAVSTGFGVRYEVCCENDDCRCGWPRTQESCVTQEEALELWNNRKGVADDESESA